MSAKEIAKAKREMEEAEMKRFAENYQREKKEAELEKRRMMEQLARDKEERFGKKFDTFTQQETKKEHTPFENFDYYIKAHKTLFPKFRAQDETLTCFNTLRVILNNIVKNPNEEKFRKVKWTNPNVAARVGKYNLAVKALKAIGFVEDGEFWALEKPDFDLVKQAVDHLEKDIEEYS